MLYVKLFGAPSLSWNGESFELSRRQARALLYRLAADSAPIPRGQLGFLFWPDVDDRKARQNLTRLVSFIRGALPDPDLIISGRDDIGFDAQRCESDCRRFSRQLEQHDEAALAEAIALYRGPFLSGFELPGSPEYENWLYGEQGRYEQRYLNTLANMVDYRSAAGDHDRAISYAQRYLAADELAEEIHRRLISLHAAAGDRAAAQRQYESCVTILERELGVDPLPETRAAYQAALTEERPVTVAAPDTPPVKPQWTVLPSLDLPLIGRSGAWDQLDQAYLRLASGGVIFIGGEPGVGKSRLLQEFADASKDRLILTGNGHARSRDLPYQLIVQALRLALARPGLWAGIRSIWLAEAQAILPELSQLFVDLPEPLKVDPGQAQARLFEALSQIALTLAGRQPLLICLDDIHWADEATLDWLEYLSGRLRDSDLCLIATYRSQEAQPLTNLRQTLRRAGLQTDISLSGLSVQAIAAILNQLPATGRQPPPPSPHPLAPRLHYATAGNAYFVLETIRILIENDQLDDPPADLPLPDTIQEAISGRLSRLDSVARQVLEAAAVLTPDLNYELLGRTAGRGEAELVDGLDQLVGRHMLRDVGREGFGFQHDLLRGVVYDGLTVWRRRMLHRRAAEALDELRGGRKEDLAARIARHYESAGEINLAVAFYQEAAGVAQDRYAYREAIALARQAIQLLPEAEAASAARQDLLQLLADNLAAIGQFAESETVYRKALAESPTNTRSGKLERCRQAELCRKLAAVLKPKLAWDEADHLYDRALAQLEDLPDTPLPAQEIWLQIQLDRLDLYYLQARVEEMASLTAEIEPLVRHLDDPYYLTLYYAALTRQRFHLERFRLSPETVQIGRVRLDNALKSGDPREIAEQQFGMGFILLWAGRLDEAIEPLQIGLAAADELEHAFLQVCCLAYLSILYRLRGNPLQVKHYLGRSEGISNDDKFPYYVGVEHASQAWLAYLNSDWDAAVPQARSALVTWEDSIFGFRWLAHWILLAHCLTMGNLEQAGAAAAAMLSPEHQRLPDELTAALEEVMQAGESGAVDALRQKLEQALDLARQAGYL
jgi:DNA-binding SARP family transcriptional activator